MLAEMFFPKQEEYKTSLKVIFVHCGFLLLLAVQLGKVLRFMYFFSFLILQSKSFHMCNNHLERKIGRKPSCLFSFSIALSKEVVCL